MADDPDLPVVLDRELRLLDPAVRRSRTIAAELLDPEFREFGASGRVWDRESMLDVMAGHDESPPLAEDLVATRLADHVIHVTYRTGAPDGPRCAALCGGAVAAARGGSTSIKAPRSPPAGDPRSGIPLTGR